MLLGQEEIDPDKPTNHDRTPLSYSAGHGHVVVVKVLLGQEGVNPNRPDDHGQTPLMSAAKLGYRKAVALLQARETVIYSDS